jgi:IS30 family transposase
MPKNIKIRGIDYVEVKDSDKKVKNTKKVSKRPPTLYNKFVSDHWNDEKITGDAKTKMKSIAVLWSKEKTKKA